MSEQGAHYKVVLGEQHHERAIRLNLNWYASNITKYAERAPHKGQMVEDLIKVLDYTTMWLTSKNKVTMPFILSSDQERRIAEIMGKLISNSWHGTAKLDPAREVDTGGAEATSAYTGQN